MLYLIKPSSYFADDTNLFIASKDPYLLNSTVNDAINKLSIWFIAKRLSLNLDKTCYMVFLPHRSDSNVYFNVEINGVTINKVKSCRYLGLIIDDELKWTEHMGHIYQYLLKYVGIFYNSEFLPV